MGKNEKKVVGRGRRRRMVRGARWWGEGWGLVGVRAGVMVAVGGMLEGRGRGYWFDFSQRLIVHRFLVVVVVVVVIYFAPSADLHRRTGAEESQGSGGDTFRRRGAEESQGSGGGAFLAGWQGRRRRAEGGDTPLPTFGAGTIRGFSLQKFFFGFRVGLADMIGHNQCASV